MSQKPFKVFYVTDIHGSEICWHKFLNAGTSYQADVVIVGGDMTGKAMVPVDQDPLDLEGFQMISLGWSNPTPWNTFRELPENELAKRVDELVAKVTDPSRMVFNFHAPYRSGLDEAPGLDENLTMKAGGRVMQPVGSTSVRTAIERVQPPLGLYGHIHESRGAVRIVRTLALNPGSSYEEGVLQGALVTLDPKKPR